jgi:outer membrane protein OmpU
MKKLLLATSILAGSAGVAAAEVTFSGNAYIGLSNNWDYTDPTLPPVIGDDFSEFEFITRVRFAVSMSGETDGGLTFGAGFDSQNAANAGSTGNSSTQGSATAYISGSFGKITFGDVGDASDNLIGNVDGVGVNLDGHTYNELGYVGNDKTAVKYEGTFGNLSVTAGVGQLDSNNDGGDDQDYSVAVKYSFGDFAVYAGHAVASLTGVETTETTIGADATFGNFTVKARAQDNSAETSETYALSATGTFDAISVTAYAAQHDTFTAYGIGGSYDLGGGAKFVAGAAQADYDAGHVFGNGETEETLIDVGLKFSF